MDERSVFFMAFIGLKKTSLKKRGISSLLLPQRDEEGSQSGILHHDVRELAVHVLRTCLRSYSSGP
jgi:hypothetical protein